ncbi:uridine kinase [Pelagicoccus sp. SDUM812005]|uniref:uridine kinase n=1 Tax=Pelagicoccus sp. SDUM812005 TaxID=3041257 RepID=UPI00281087B3|nr:uridine kinase [Pelagicoccus sp. SDUM812005]MDQ8182408.1 uridine kinase [Pelagicoccus sp. SDUM812005]
MRKPTLLGITGGSGSGKSWLAKHLQEQLGSHQLVAIQQDWYYRDLSHLPADEAAKTDFDDPAALELDLLESQLQQLSQGHPVDAPQYDFSTFSRKTQPHPIQPRPVILVEGLFVLHRQSLARRLDLSVYVDTPSDLRLLRRIRRDLSERGYQLERILDFWEHDQIPSFTKFVQPQRERASLIWDSLQDTALVPALLADLKNRISRYADQPTT